MISFVAFTVKRAWQGFWRNAVMSLAATATMVLMLLLLAGFWILLSGVAAGVEYVEQKVDVVVDLQDSATPARTAELAALARSMPEVRAVTYISKDEALARFRETRAARGEQDLTYLLETNPLPASLEIALRGPTDYAIVIERLGSEAGVRSVKSPGEVVEQLRAVTDVIRTVGWALLIGIGLIVLFIVVNTIRLAVVARADEIEIMRLVGASDAFIRWPFVLEGAFVGLLGAAVALGVLGAAADPIGRFMFEFFQVLPLRAEGLAYDVILIVSGTGIGLGVLGAWLSVRAYLVR